MSNITPEELELGFCWFDAQYYFIYKDVKDLPDDVIITFKIFTPKKEVIETQTMDVGALKKMGREIEERHPNIREYVEKELYKNKEE